MRVALGPLRASNNVNEAILRLLRPLRELPFRSPTAWLPTTEGQPFRGLPLCCRTIYVTGKAKSRRAPRNNWRGARAFNVSIT
jgi:hypothetical protein